MLQTIKNIFSVKELRNKIIFTLFILLLFRFGTYITIPGIDKLALRDAIGTGEGGISALVNLVSGGAFSRLSILALSIGPYITASIVLNLLQVIVPSLERLSKEGEEGRKKLNKYTKYLTVAFALLEGLAAYLNYKAYLLPVLQSGAGQILGVVLFIGSLIAGTALLSWLGDKITEYGVGNGISMIVFIGIVAGISSGAETLFEVARGGISGILIVVALIAVMLVLITGIVFVQQAERRIPVNYAKRVVGRKMYGGQSTHIPIKLAMAGVMPLIFAMSFMMFPSMIISFATKGNPQGIWSVIYNLFSVSQGSHWYYLVGNALIYMLLIILFTFVYTMFIVNPVRAGKTTSDYISSVLKNITTVGAIFLALVAVLPIALQGITDISITFSGNSVLIAVSVALEILQNLETQMVSRNYSGFLG